MTDMVSLISIMKVLSVFIKYKYYSFIWMSRHGTISMKYLSNVFAMSYNLLMIFFSYHFIYPSEVESLLQYR